MYNIFVKIRPIRSTKERYKMKNFFAEFKKFITRGNVVDMAVGVIVGGAFTAIVNALSNNILKPVINWLLALIFGADSLSELFTFLTKVTLSPHFDSFENAALVCANACVTLSGALPFMLLVSKVLAKPLHWLGSKLGINGVSALAFLGSTVTNASTFGIMDRMDRKGVVLNAAFAVSASFTFGSHLAFTMAFDGSYILPMIAAKLLSGLCALLLALLIWKE